MPSLKEFDELHHKITLVKGFLDLCSTIEEHSFLTCDFNILAGDLKTQLTQACDNYENIIFTKSE